MGVVVGVIDGLDGVEALQIATEWQVVGRRKR